MKRFLIILFLSALSLNCKETKSTKDTDTTVFYLIRHAEKDRSDKTNRNPNLKPEGIERAKGWAKYFNDVNLDKVYSTNYNRTKETATPTAKSKKLDLKIYNPSNIDGVAFIEKNKGKKILVVGHSNTTPMFTNALLGEKKYEYMEDNDNASLFVVTIDNEGNKSSEVLKVN